MINDPIVEEVRTARMKISEQHGHDLHRLCEYFRSVEREHPERVVDFSRESEKPSIESILHVLNESQIRATYQAVAEVLGVHYRNASRLLGERRIEASWIVSKETCKPSGYDEDMLHPNLEKNPHVINSGKELRALLEAAARRSP